MISSKITSLLFHSILIKFCLLLLLLPNILSACDVPVFRFALERWVNDPYILLIKHPAELNDNQLEKLTTLRNKYELNKAKCNLVLKIEESTENDFVMELRYPEVTGIIRPAWVGDFNLENFDRIIDSPTRKDIHKKIINGTAIVWIVLKSGNNEQDKSFVKKLQEMLPQIQSQFSISKNVKQAKELDQIDGSLPQKELDNILYSTIPLDISFEIIELDKDNMNEQVFVQTLINQSISMIDINEPVAIPIFGRARCLDGIKSSELDLNKLHSTCSYLCSACSCTVKAENPGVDLLSNFP